MNNYDEYKVIHVVEGGCGTLLLGSSGLPLKKIRINLKHRSFKWLASSFSGD